MRILMSGAGIAGPTLAYWLTDYGFDCTIVEAAPSLRTGGYMIDFWGAGFDVADRMGLLPAIRDKGYSIREVRVVGRDGHRVSGFPADAVAKMLGGRFTSLPRGDLAACICTAIEGRVEAIFGDSVAHLDQTDRAVHVGFRRGATRDFDLVIGADGLHSRVRELVFGPQSRFEKYLGYKVAAFQTQGYEPRDELVYVMFTELRQQVARVAMRGGRTMFLFTFADENFAGGEDLAAQKAVLRSRFGQSGWECPKILDALDAAGDLYFDRVSQVRMNQSDGLWTRNRVTLLGDAAFCVSFLAGQGSALAMVAAYILAGELHRARGDYAAAFARYQNLFGPFVARKQKAALRFAEMFAPRSRTSLWLRNQIFRLLSVPPLARLAAGRDFVDKISVPDY